MFSAFLALWGQFTGNRCVSSQRKCDSQLRFLWWKPKQTFEQAVEMPVIWDTMAHMWRHCSGRILIICVLLFWNNDIKYKYILIFPKNHPVRKWLMFNEDRTASIVTKVTVLMFLPRLMKSVCGSFSFKKSNSILLSTVYQRTVIFDRTFVTQRSLEIAGDCSRSSIFLFLERQLSRL